MNIVLGRHTWIIPIGLVVYWSVFVSLWGFWGWNDAVLFSEWWLFDTLGHACFGFGGTLTFLYLYRNYTLRGWFLFGGQKFLVMAIVTAVAFTGVLWEFFEGSLGSRSFGRNISCQRAGGIVGHHNRYPR